MYMRNLFLALVLTGFTLPAYSQAADNLGVYLAADSAAAAMGASNHGGGCFFLHGPKKPKKPKIEHLANGNIKVDGKEYTPVINETPISTFPDGSTVKPAPSRLSDLLTGSSSSPNNQLH
jgi:hypothetical protein